MAEKFISIEGIAKRFPAPGGGTTTVFEDLWLSMSAASSPASSAIPAAARPPCSTSSPASTSRRTAP